MVNKRIFLSPPHMTGKEKEFFEEGFKSNWIAPLGPNVDAFEKEMCNYLGIKNSCSLASGTAALHLALRILGVSKGDYVLCPSLTFAATANVVLYESATPIFIDVDRKNWTIDTTLLEKTIKHYKPKALISVDLYGQSCNYDELNNLCEKFNVKIIEDAAEALGSNYKKKKLGSFGCMSILSFNGNKIITTSGGGMLLSDNIDYVDKAKFLSSQAREKKIYYEHKELGFNYRMSNLLAGIGRGQLLSIDEFVKKRRKIFKRYFKQLSIIDGFNFLVEPYYSKSNRWLTTLTLDKRKTGIDRNQIIRLLEEENIESRPVWKPMHLQPLYKDYDYITKKNQDISGELFNNGLCLPSGSSLSVKDQNRIIDIIISMIK